MNDMRFTSSTTAFFVILGRWEVDNVRILGQWEVDNVRFSAFKVSLSAGIEPGTSRVVGQPLAHYNPLSYLDSTLLENLRSDNL